MNVKDLFAPKEEIPEAYWSLVLEAGYVQAGIWFIQNEEAKLIATSSPCPWEIEDELLGATDAALSACVQKLPENYKEPENTVFGVASSWIENGNIKGEYLEKIKKICDELSLAPTGFVVISEAIAHYYKSIEGTPLSSIVLGVGHENLELSIFKVGELVGTTNISRSVSVLDDVVEGLTRFESVSPLPSRIIIYDGKGQELTEVSDVLSGTSWDQLEKFNFLHTPKIEILDSDKKVLSTSLAGANEIANVGKIILEEDKYGEEVKNIEVPKVMPQASDMGFLMDKEEEYKEPIQQTIPTTLVPKRNIFHDLSSKINFKVPKLNISFQNKFIVLIAGIIFLFGFAFAAWWFLPKAVVTIYVSPKKLEQDLNISFTNDDVVTTSVNGDKTRLTTGKKIIGDKAKGSVLIQNGTSNNINLKAGSILLSSGGLKFLLEESASVSAALSPSDPGKATVSVISETIGAEYNLGKDEIFKVSNYPKADVDAKSTADFSGGSSCEILAVSKDDQEKLKEELTEELIQKAKDNLLAKATSDQIIVDSFISIKEISSNFNHKVGDEAENIKLTLEIEAKTISYDRKKLADYVREKLKSQTPQGFVLRDTQIDYEFKFEEEDNTEIKYTILVSANFLPEIKNDELKKKISGKTIKTTEEYLSNIPGFSNAQISLRPLLPGRLGIIPMVLSNIEIEIAAEK